MKFVLVGKGDHQTPKCSPTDRPPATASASPASSRGRDLHETFRIVDVAAFLPPVRASRDRRARGDGRRRLRRRRRRTPAASARWSTTTRRGPRARERSRPRFRLLRPPGPQRSQTVRNAVRASAQISTAIGMFWPATLAVYNRVRPSSWTATGRRGRCWPVSPALRSARRRCVSRRRGRPLVAPPAVAAPVERRKKSAKASDAPRAQASPESR